MYVDSHCHLQLLSEISGIDIADVITKSKQQNVEQLLCVATNLEQHNQLVDYANSYPGYVSISAGVHPLDDYIASFKLKELEQQATAANVVAIGETGLDYFRVNQELDKQIQQQRFNEQIELSVSKQLPLIIHMRDAVEDTYQMLANYPKCRGVIHCFTEDWPIAQKFIALGFYISFSGIVTFKNAKKIQEAAKNIPIEYLLIETDAPYLAPTPYRGKTNFPYHVTEVAKFIAELRGESVEYIANASRENYYTLFSACS